MAKFGNQVKLAWLKGMEAIGKGASSLASNAHLKVTEINLETRRREILSEFPLRAHDLWQKGVALPDPLGDMMAELNELDEKLSVLRAQRYARVEATDTDGAADGAEQSDAAASESAEQATDGDAEAAAETEGATDEAEGGEGAACDGCAEGADGAESAEKPDDGDTTCDADCDGDKPQSADKAPSEEAADGGADVSAIEAQGEGDNA